MVLRVGEKQRIWILCHPVAVMGAMWQIAVIPVTFTFEVWAIFVVTRGTSGGFSCLYRRP